MLFLAYCREFILSTTSLISVEAAAILQTADDGNIDEPENPHSSSSTRSTSKHQRYIFT